MLRKLAIKQKFYKRSQRETFKQEITEIFAISLFKSLFAVFGSLRFVE